MKRTKAFLAGVVGAGVAGIVWFRVIGWAHDTLGFGWGLFVGVGLPLLAWVGVELAILIRADLAERKR